MSRIAINRCRYCGQPCRYNTCNASCKVKLWDKKNPEKAKERVKRMHAAHMESTRIRWVARMRELIPRDVFTKEQELIIAKALAAQNRFAFMRGFNRGRYISRK